MLGTEPDIVDAYVTVGQVRLVFWPVLNHGNPSVFSTLTMECVAQQDMAAAWELHHIMFQNQRDLWSADMDYYVNQAVAVGADKEAFTQCYTDEAAMAQVLKLDQIRQERGVYSQPVFDFEGKGYLVGAQPFDVFSAAIESLLNK